MAFVMVRSRCEKGTGAFYAQHPAGGSRKRLPSLFRTGSHLQGKGSGKVGMAFLVFHWVFRLVEEPGRPCPVWAKALAVALSLRPIIGDLSHGNINIFILFLVVGALLAFRKRHDLGCGLLLGLAIACKV